MCAEASVKERAAVGSGTSICAPQSGLAGVEETERARLTGVTRRGNAEFHERSWVGPKYLLSGKMKCVGLEAILRTAAILYAPGGMAGWRTEAPNYNRSSARHRHDRQS